MTTHELCLQLMQGLKDLAPQVAQAHYESREQHYPT